LKTSDLHPDSAGGNAPTALPSARHIPYALRAFQHRNFCLFFIGQFISRTGFWMQGMAQGWLVYRLSESSFMLGLVAFAAQFPAVVLGLFAGVVADRFDRYRVVVVSQVLFMVQALLLGILTLGGWVTVWQIFALALVAGVLLTFEMPARQSFLQDIVGKDDLTSAIALNSALVNGARIVGPALAGAIVAKSGEGVCFSLNSVGYLALIAVFLAMRLPPKKALPRPTVSTFAFIREGLAYARQTPAIRLLLILIGMLSLLSTPYTVLMPVFAKDILHSGPGGMGLLMGAAGGGAVVGTLFLARQQGTTQLGRSITYSLVSFGVGVILFSFSRSLWFSLVLLPLVGAGFMVPMSAANTLLQTLTPDRLRGRVMSLFLMMFMGTPPVGSLLAGFLAPHIGAPLTVALTGMGGLGAAIWFAARVSSLHADKEQEAPTGQ
jgi:MFS family permease